MPPNPSLIRNSLVKVTFGHSVSPPGRSIPSVSFRTGWCRTMRWVSAREGNQSIWDTCWFRSIPSLPLADAFNVRPGAVVRCSTWSVDVGPPKLTIVLRFLTYWRSSPIDPNLRLRFKIFIHYRNIRRHHDFYTAPAHISDWLPRLHCKNEQTNEKKTRKEWTSSHSSNMWKWSSAIL